MRDSDFTGLGQLENCEQHRQDLPRLCVGSDKVAPARARAHREYRPDHRDCAVDIERPRHDVVHVRSFRSTQNAVYGTEQLADRSRERADRRGRHQVLREVRASEAVSAIVAASFENVHDLAHLLVLEQPSYQLRARIFPLFVTFPPREQHLRLDANESGRHLQIVGGLVETERRDAVEELLGDPGDRDVVNIDLLVTDERE